MQGYLRATTESELRDWRHGALSAERLAAALLRLTGYEDVDPQAPLGGPDGGKDILCQRGSIKYVAAVYFPPSGASYADLKRKFVGDLAKAKALSRGGFIFITNQPLTVGERDQLQQLAVAEQMECVVFHQEQIRIELDSTKGYGVRLQYLHIPMNEAEQFAYFSDDRESLDRRLEAQTRYLVAILQRLDRIAEDQVLLGRTVSAMSAHVAPPMPSSLSTIPPVGLLVAGDPSGVPASAALSIEILRSVHRLACADLPVRLSGHLREVQVWIGGIGASLGDASFVPPPAAEIPALLEGLLTSWNRAYGTVSHAPAANRLEAVAAFHAGLLAIHPFVDGNGRLARALLIQQCLDLFGAVDAGLLDRGAQYHQALRRADQGDLSGLVEVIGRALPDGPPQLASARSSLERPYRDASAKAADGDDEQEGPLLAPHR